MDTRPFKLDKDELYVSCYSPFRLPNGNYSGLIRVYELQKPEKQYMLTNMDWSLTPEIVASKSTTGYNSLEIQGQLVDFDKLVQDLCRSRLWVNRRGYCFQSTDEITDTREANEITFYRLNDLWKWSDYGVMVDLLSNTSALTNWNRLYILDGSKPTKVSDYQDIVIKCQLEETKIQLREKNYEVIRLKSELYKKDGENETLKDQVAMLDGENKTLKDQVEMLDSVIREKYAVICEKNAENQAFAEEVKRLESELEDARRRPSTSSSSPNNPPVPCSVFVLKLNPFRWAAYTPYVNMHWAVRQGVLRILTPSHEPVNTTFPIPVTIYLIPGYSFDVTNWFYMRVVERTAPILIYEGNAYSITVGGNTITSPVERSSIIYWGGYADRGHEYFDFEPVSIVGYGTRIAVLQR